MFPAPAGMNRIYIYVKRFFYLVFPAPAGMNRNCASCDRVRDCVPRACGDEPEARK
uniref:Uncharacterized protein n=1 Tax=mine drainage metagenome TaxID=410659 RepID=E6QU54_9ZZZZ